MNKYINFIINYLDITAKLSRKKKFTIIFTLDFFISFCSIFITYFGFSYLNINNHDNYIFLILLCTGYLPLAFYFGIYKILNRESLILILYKIYLLYFISLSLIFILDIFIDIKFFKIFSIIYFTIFILGTSFSRILISKIDLNLFRNIKSESNFTFIYGVGAAGKYLLNELNKKINKNNIIFIDDDKSKQNMIFEGHKIISPNDLDHYLEKNCVKEIILAMPSIDKVRRIEIIDKLQKKNVKIKSVPSYLDIAKGNNFNNLNNIELSDLLNKSSYNLNNNSKYYIDKTILITGAGGTIGGGLSERLLYLAPKKLILIDISEYNLFNIIEKLKALKKNLKINTDITYNLISIRDKEEITTVFRNNSIDFVFHAAAYKHVHILEENLIPAVQNNIIGTKILCDLSLKFNVKKFLFVSSDKAVRPTNILGACKRLSELYVKSINEITNHSKFFSVRFGNVLGSSGSAFNTFIRQIENKDTITLTSKEMTRYFMTIEEAVSLLITTLELSKGKELFVLDMGEPYNIYNLVKKLVNLYGLTIRNNSGEGDIELKITGLRKGEKLFEELFIKDNYTKTIENKILVADEPSLEYEKINSITNSLDLMSRNSQTKEIKKIFCEVVEGYKNI